MTTDFEARRASVGVGWDHHAQDAFTRLNWVTIEAKLWQAPALTAQACQKTLILTLASRACHNVYTEIVIQSHLAEWEEGCYSDHNHRTDSRPQNQWTAAFKHDSIMSSSEGKKRQSTKCKSAFFLLSTTSWRTIHKVVVVEDQRPEMSHLLEHHLISRRQTTLGSTFFSLSFTAAALNLHICIEYLNSHSATARPLRQPSRWNTRFSYIIHGEISVCIWKMGHQQFTLWKKEEINLNTQGTGAKWS